MRIALVSTPFVAVPPRAYGGTELVVHALARALVRAGHEVAVFATGDSRVPLHFVRGPEGAFPEVVDVQGDPLAVRIEV